MPGFVHLHTHSEYSLLDGLSSPKALAQQAAQLGMPALALTDHGVMYGIVEFYKACREAGIKPIIGIETYLAPKSRLNRTKEDGSPYHLVLLAQNQTGYLNILQLASIAQLEGFYYKPRIDKEVLERYSEGIIVLSACASGEVPRLLLQGQETAARQAIRWYQERFPGRFYLELQTHRIPELEPVYAQLVALGRELAVPLVATNDIHYARREQADAHDVLLCIQTGKTVNEPQRMRMSDPSYYMRSPAEMWDLYSHLPDALENTLSIADQCQVEIKFAPPYHLPKFPVPADCGDSEHYLRHLCEEGCRQRYGAQADTPAVRERLEYELGIIHRMGFDDYFLIVWDLVRAAQERDIWWNVRGSGAGSVVAYTLGITSVDPLKNRLLFERFLNPGRISMPDIDLDFPDDRREELIAYTVQRYGHENVAQIITFGTLGARAAVRDVGRAMDIPLSEVDKVARLIPNIPGKPVSIAEALEQVPELKEIYQTTPYLKKLMDMAAQVEGVARHASTHAAGVVISDRPLTDYLPLNRPTRGETVAGEDDEGGAPASLGAVTQWPMEILDELGMLKVDFLGLRTLTQMRLTCDWIARRHGRQLDLATIPYERIPDDPVADADVRQLYDLLSSGNTTGIFQVEGAGMRRVLQEMRPTQFQHIVAVLALYRPGPMEQIPTFIKRMHGEEPVEYKHPILQNILDDTYAIIVYQEQIMQIAVAMAGYEPGEADGIRKAVAKKKRELMDKHKRMFTEGADKRGISREIAEAVWADIEFFARYGFNRAHATDYAVITGQTAYLKAHYPVEFMAALMTTERGNTEKLGFLIGDARRNGIEVVRPCLNRSHLECTIEDQDGRPVIRIGLGAIKNVGDDAVRLIVEARAAGGPFRSLDDLAERVDLRRINRRVLECLIQAGALDDLANETGRAGLLATMDPLFRISAQRHSAREIGQFSLFDGLGAATDTLRPPARVPPIPNRKLLEWEKELLGTYLSEHPLLRTEHDLYRQGLVTCSLADAATAALGQQVTLVGMVQRIRRVATKKGDMMAFVTLEGPGGTLDLVVFPKTLERFKQLLVPEKILVASGKLDARPDREDHPLIVDWVKEPHELLGAADSAPVAPPPALRERPIAYATADRHPQPAREDYPPTTEEGIGGEEVDLTASEEPDDEWRFAPAPEEPPAPSCLLRITVQRTNNSEADFGRIAQIHQLLSAQSGADHFVIVLENGGGSRVELHFPNNTTRWSPDLGRQVEQILGAGCLKVN